MTVPSASYVVVATAAAGPVTFGVGVMTGAAVDEVMALFLLQPLNTTSMTKLRASETRCVPIPSGLVKAILQKLVAMRWQAYMNMRSGGSSRNRLSKCRERNSSTAQVFHDGLSFGAIRIQ